MSTDPKAPKADTPEALGFKKEKMVAWFDPGVLSQSAVQALLADTFGKYADNREIQAAFKLDDPPYTDLSHKKEIWFDYIADSGDGWNSTYTMARLLAEQRLTLTDTTTETQYATQRGDFLIMGGDQVYPTASKEEYNNRLVGPYRSALPWMPEGKHPLLFAIPGNHDWYDGLVSFSRLFHHKRWIGGWETQQTRSYFAIKLAHDWWVWGIDIQLGSEIDAAQVDYFKMIAQCMRNHSKLIICSAEPSWVYAEQKGYKAYDNMAYFEKRVIEDRALNYQHDFMVGLSGDLHTYARYADTENTGKQRFIAGGGGAYLYPTHDLPETLNIPQMTDSPPAVTIEQFKIGSKTNRQNPPANTTENDKAFYPDRLQSRFIAGYSLMFPFKNLWFCLLAGSLYFLIAWVLESISHSMDRIGLFEAFSAEDLIHTNDILTFSMITWAFNWMLTMCVNSPTASLLLVAVFVGLFLFAKAGFTAFKRFKPVTSQETAGTTLNAMDQNRTNITCLALAVLNFLMLFISFIFTLSLTLKFIHIASLYGFGAIVQGVVFITSMVVIGGFFGGAIMGIYLWFSNLIFRAHSNEVFSCQSSPDYKNFLRLHIDKTGKLTIFPVGVDKACSSWKLNRNAKNSAPWFEPEKGQIGQFAGLIETPIEVKHKKRPSLFRRLFG